MPLISTYTDVLEYRKKLERQLEVLLISPAFNTIEVIDLTELYNELIAICNTKIASQLEVNDANYL